MKKHLLLSFFAVITSIGFATAQLEEGSYTLGTSFARLSIPLYSQGTYSVGVSPNGGYFLQDNVLLGAGVAINYNNYHNWIDSSCSSNLNFGVSVMPRYYFGNTDNGAWLVGANGTLWLFTGAGNNNSTFTASIHGGRVIFLNKSIGLEILGNIGDLTNTNSMTLSGSVGLQIYFDGKTSAGGGSAE